MNKVREALRTVVTLLKSPWGYGAPIPRRPRFDAHLLASVGEE
jgi:hypothetical protein